MPPFEPDTIPDDFWRERSLLASLRTRDLQPLLQRLNTCLGISQMEIGALIGIDQGQVCKIINGETTVRHFRVFERVADRLKMPDHARMALGLAPVTFPVLDPELPVAQPGGHDGGGGQDTSAARSCCQEEILAMTIRRAREFTLAAGQFLAAEVLEQLHGDTRTLARSYPQKPLIELLGDLADTQDALYVALDSRPNVDNARQLYLLAGAVGGMLAKASHDMGDPHGALAHSRTAFLCAEQAGHDGLRAWVKGLQSLIAYWASRPHEALRYAQDGSRYAARTSGTTAVWLAVNEARAWAALGNADEALAAIHRAEATRDRTTPDELDQLGGICTFGPSRLLYYAADALALLPERAAQAEEYSLLALDAYGDRSASDWSFSDQAGSAADLAIARLAQNQIDAAADAISSVLDLPAEQRINGIVASLQRVHRALGGVPRSAEATQLQQDIESFTSAPLAGLPR